MPTNDERREAASRLRRYLSYAKMHDADESTDPCVHGNKMFRNIAQAVGGGISNITDTYEETLVKLIDLIEPEPERTCKFIPFIEDDGSVFIENCSECDAAVLSRCEFNYCPNCGARVTEVVS